MDLPNQGLNPGLPHCRQILDHLSYQGSSRMLEWIAYPFSGGIFLTQESNWGLLHCMDSLPAELPGKPELLICTKIFYSHNFGYYFFKYIFYSNLFLLYFWSSNYIYISIFGNAQSLPQSLYFSSKFFPLYISD